MSNSRSNDRCQEHIPQHRDTIRHSVKLLTHIDTHDATPRTESTNRHDKGEDHQALPLIRCESVARQLAVRHTVRVRGSLAEAGHLVLLVRLKVALEPVPVVGRFLSTLPREDMGGNAVEEPTVVGDDDGAAGERQEGVFQ